MLVKRLVHTLYHRNLKPYQRSLYQCHLASLQQLHLNALPYNALQQEDHYQLIHYSHAFQLMELVVSSPDSSELKLRKLNYHRGGENYPLHYRLILPIF